MCFVESAVAVKTVSSHKGALLLLVEDILHIYKSHAGKIEVDTCPVELLIEERHIKSRGIESGNIASGDKIGELGCDDVKCRLVGHILIGDMVDCSRFLGYVHTGIDSAGMHGLAPVGVDLDDRNLHDAVVGYGRAGGLKIKKLLAAQVGVSFTISYRISR